MAALDIVQHAAAQSPGTANTAGDLIPVTLASAPTVGNLLLLVVTAAGAGAGAAVPTWGGYDTNFTGQLAASGYNDANVNCYSHTVATGESATVNVTVAATGQAVAVVLIEVTAPGDVQSSTSGRVTGASVSVSTVAATAAALLPDSTDDLAVAVTGLHGFGSALSGFAADHSFTSLGSVQTAAGANSVGAFVATRRYSPSGGGTVVSFSDFTQNSNTAGLRFSGSLVGPGRAARTYQMVPYTSTKAGLVPTAVGTTTNPFMLLVFGGLNTGGTVNNPEISDFTLLGTPQGHNYHGMQVGYSSGANIHDLFIKGIPGSGNANPQETFSLSLWHANGSTVTHVDIDGRDSTGAGVGASLFGLNSSANVLIADCSAHYATYGMGLTAWKCQNVEILRFDASRNRRPFNFENCLPGYIRLTGCDMRYAGKRPHVTCNTNYASSVLTITDPVVDAWPIRVGVTAPGTLYLGRPQLQRVSDVHLIVGGVDRTSDPAYLFAGNAW